MTNSKVNIKVELKLWGIYFVTILLSTFFHELGHCTIAWTHGFSAVPTPAKAYLMESIPSTLNNYFALGGIISSLVFPLILFTFVIASSFRLNSAILAGGIAMPGMYSLRFLVIGRGHDATEFQEAQSALGVNYSGHFLDWLFSTLFLMGIFLWAFKSKPNYKIAGRILIGFVLTFIFILLLQKINNLIFDPIFSAYENHFKNIQMLIQTHQPTMHCQNLQQDVVAISI